MSYQPTRYLKRYWMLSTVKATGNRCPVKNLQTFKTRTWELDCRSPHGRCLCGNRWLPSGWVHAWWPSKGSVPWQYSDTFPCRVHEAGTVKASCDTVGWDSPRWTTMTELPEVKAICGCIAPVNSIQSSQSSSMNTRKAGTMSFRFSSIRITKAFWLPIAFPSIIW